MKKSFNEKNTYAPNKYAEKLIFCNIFAYLLFICGDEYSNKQCKNSISRIYEVIFLLFSDSTTENIIKKMIEKTLIRITGFEKRMINEMTIVTDPIKLTLYFNFSLIIVTYFIQPFQ